MSRQEGAALSLARIVVFMVLTPDQSVAPSSTIIEPSPRRAQRSIGRAALWVLGSLGLIVALLGLIPRALRYEPPFYRAALATPPETRRLQSERFLATLLDLRNDMANEPVWETRWTEDQVNSWLAEHLELDSEGILALPHDASVWQPRLGFERDRARLAFRGRLLGLETVFEAVFSVVYDSNGDSNLSATGVEHPACGLVLEIESVSAGLVPLPVGFVADRLLERGVWPGFVLKRDPTSNHPGRLLVTLDSEGQSILTRLSRLEILQGAVRLTGGQLADPASSPFVVGDRSASDQPAARR
jgi:hypothetical protein